MYSNDTNPSYQGGIGSNYPGIYQQYYHDPYSMTQQQNYYPQYYDPAPYYAYGYHNKPLIDSS